MSLSARICNQCGAVVPDGHHYCCRCGARYDEEGVVRHNETMFFGAMQTPGRAKLILIKGEGLEGLSYHLNSAEHIAGRKQKAILFPEDKYLSPKHAMFRYRDNQLYLRDEGSLNGTFLRIREPRVLQSGDELMIGEQLLRVELLEGQGEYPMFDGTLMYVCPPRPHAFRLQHIVRGGKPGSSFCSVHNDLLIGREGCDVNFTDDRHASRKHARVTWDGEQLIVTDLDSRNGTFLRIRGEERLRHGDYVAFGSELMRVEINE